MLLAHWLACSFCFLREATDQDCDWVNAYVHFQDQDAAEVFSSPCIPRRVSLLTEYLSALYWSAMTISTVGYGDIVPTNNGERAFVICGLFVGASFFSYVVGSVCSVLAKLSEKEEEFQVRHRPGSPPGPHSDVHPVPRCHLILPTLLLRRCSCAT